MACVLLGALLAGCSRGARPIPPEERGTPTTLPPEQLLYREARETLQAWLASFDGGPGAAGAYPLLSTRSRSLLRAQGVTGAEGFASWWAVKAGESRAPFVYRFTRVDVLDVDMRDSVRALITAGFVVSAGDAETESTGTFTLLRERGAWRVPFAERPDFESGWWQKERAFSLQLRESGLVSYSSQVLNLDLRYPVAWDVREGSDAAPPGVGKRPALRLTYVNPVTDAIEATVWILAGTEIPAATEGTADRGTSRALRRVEESDAALPGSGLKGRRIVLEDPATGRRFEAITAWNPAITAPERFDTAFSTILSSVTPVYE